MPPLPGTCLQPNTQHYELHPETLLLLSINFDSTFIDPLNQLREVRLPPDPRRPSLEQLLEDYWHIMPEYQGVPLSALQPQRILFGFFPTYRASPLPSGFDRVLQVGDASGIQSPLSFGGFGALTRHMPRLVSAITDALHVSPANSCMALLQ